MKLKMLLLSLFVTVGALATVRAEDAAVKAAADRQTMVEMHEKMAEAHKQTAECLKAGKPAKECQDALAAQCPKGKGGGCAMMGDNCPMGKGMRGQGRGKGRGMGAPSAAPVKPSDDKKP